MRIVSHPIFAAALVLAAAMPRASAEPLSAPDLARARAAEAARCDAVQRVFGSVVAVYRKDPGRGGGSGVVIHPDGWALTNYHVVRAAGKRGKAGLADGNLYPWQMYGTDPGGDLAVIRLEGDAPFPAAPLGASRTVRAGDWALAMGNPFVLAEDQRPTVTLGIVSGVGRFQHGLGGRALVYGNCIQIDTSINPGNSGGPLFDAAGRLIGINGRGSFEERGRVNVGVGYAVSLEQARNFLPDLIASKLCRHGTLDATFVDAGERVICDAVHIDSPVGRLGLRPGDQLVAFDGRPVGTANQFLNRISILPAGWPVEVTFRHDERPVSGRVRLTPLPYGRALRPPTRARAEPVPDEDGNAHGEPDADPDAEPDGQPDDDAAPAEASEPAEPPVEPGAIMDADRNREACRWLLGQYVAFLGGREAVAAAAPVAWPKAVAGGAEDAAVARAVVALTAPDPLDAFEEVELEGGDRAAGRRAFRLRVTPPDGPACTLWFSVFDDRGGFEVRLLKAALASEAERDGRAWTFGDYRPDGGVMVPHRVRRVHGLAEQVAPEPAAGDDHAAKANRLHEAIARARARCVKIYGGGAGREHGYATGLVVSPDGLILTAQGMFLSEERVRVLLPDGSRHAAAIVRRSERLQAAVLKIDASTPEHFRLTSVSPVREGDWVLAVSNAFNVAGPREPLAAGLGIVSLRADLEARHRRQDVPYEGDVLLVDAITSNPGAPGGALVTADGRLAGMIGKIFRSPNTNTRINYAVPVERLHALVARPGGGDTQEATTGRPYVGIRLFTLSGKRAPAYVDRVDAGSPAAAAGVRKDDLILAVGGKAVRTCEDCQEALAGLVPGRAVGLLLKRGRRILTVSITPGRKEGTP